MFPRFVVGLVQATYAIPLFRASLRQCVWLCLFATTAFAQSGPYRFDHWTTDNGLPQNTVSKIVQTRDGYLWMTTFDGLARFDGVRFTVFDKGNTTAIKSNRLLDLAGDGSLLIATQDGGLTVYKNGSFTAYTTADGLPGNYVSGFSSDFNGEPVISTTGGPVYLRDGKFVPAPPQYGSRQMKLYLAPSGARVTIDARGVTWVKDGREIHYPIPLSANNYAAEMWAFEDSRGNLWLTGRNLYVLRDGQITRFPEGVAIGPMCEDADGGVWFTLFSRTKSGVYFPARFKDGRFTIFGEADGVLRAPVNSIISDREGSVWSAWRNARAGRRLQDSFSPRSGDDSDVEH